MASIPLKTLKREILALLERKGEIRQEGRLIAHLINELNLTSHSTIREPLAEALIKLEEDGLVVLIRKGNVIDGVRRTTRKRARPTRREEVVAQPTAPAVSPAPAPVALEPELPTQPEPIAEAPLDGLQLVVRLTQKVEDLTIENQLLEEQMESDRASAQADVQRRTELETLNAEMSRAVAAAQESLSRADAQLTEREERIERLSRELAAANASLNEGATVLERLRAQLQQEQLKNEQLEAENAAIKARATDFDALATRVANALK